MSKIVRMAFMLLGATVAVALATSGSRAQVSHRLEQPQAVTPEEFKAARKSAKPAEKILKQLPKELFPPSTGSGSEQPPSVVSGSPGANQQKGRATPPPN